MKNMLMVFLMTFFLSLVSFGQGKSEQELYSVMVLNFLKYIQWPEEGSSGDTFTIGIYGDQDVYGIMSKLAAGKNKSGKSFVVKSIKKLEEITDCQAVFIGKGKDNELDEIKRLILTKSILTITASEGLGRKGSMINFAQVDGKLKFELNQGATAKASLKIANALSSLSILI